MNKNTSEESNKSKNSNSDSTNLTFVSIQASRRTTRCSRTSWFFEELRTSGQRRNNMLGCSNAVLFGCLVFLAAFIGLYFVIEIQAKSKIAEVPDPRPQNPQNAENFSRMVELLRNECHDNNVWAENLDNKKWCSTSWDLIFAGRRQKLKKPPLSSAQKLQRKCYYNATTETAEWQSYKTKAEQLADGLYGARVLILECLTDEKSHLSKNIINIVIIMNIVGASISCLALGLSIIILSSLRKIRSTRNHIHCNLFLAWIFNTIFKCLLFVQGNNWAHLLNGCAITILAVYGSIIQMSWTLIEGIHLHLLLSISHFPKTWSFKCFITCAIICYL
ncbi:Oidioi.mRNA.OKI2018_I69.XSR.g14334.t2.cds [Oikopleura dioica]|uniref:Oidioi.mRNA.OKI2018_I69.XSR.g14334.t2.cds n=1 Tax=Oikopleura dioica TaxID=34765 RepID=A0ABN7S9G5_OIKDI|nr:Oidioi.mRNA.OKI2018_I69.XSR.g14334.t2.cds [Oikopleura dioica]